MRISDLPYEYERCFEYVSRALGDKLPDVELRFILSENMETGFDGRTGYVACNAKNRFARLLALFSRYYKEQGAKPFKKTEKANFETLSCMMDASNGSTPTVKSAKELCDTMAMMGYNQLQWYVEDTYHVEGRPFFGYLRGRYSFEELKEIDDYAFDLGIEVVPCMQTLGHLANYMKWPEAANVSENHMVLLPDSERTYEFIEKMIKAISAPFRSRRIHIGCDETHGLGTGNYLKTHEYTKPLEVFVKHVTRVAQICEKLGLKPMMWNDMFFAFSSPSYDNYDVNVTFTQELKKSIAPNLELVFWHYGQRPGCETKMIAKHRELGKDPIFAGASRMWQSILPDNYFSASAAESSLKLCRENGIKEVMLTVWSYSSRIYQVAYLTLCHYGELTYNLTSDELKANFEFITDLSYDAFMRMSDLNDLYDSEEARAATSYVNSGRGVRYYSCDPLLNIMENDFLKTPRSGYYASAAEFFKPYTQTEGKWQFLYQLAYYVFRFMTVKSQICETLTPAYKSADRATLENIYSNLLPEYTDLILKIADTHGYHKDTYLKGFGCEIMDQSYGGMRERARTLERRLRNYLNGTATRIDELEEPKLDYKGGPFTFV